MVAIACSGCVLTEHARPARVNAWLERLPWQGSSSSPRARRRSACTGPSRRTGCRRYWAERGCGLRERAEGQRQEEGAQAQAERADEQEGVAFEDVEDDAAANRAGG